MKNKLNDLIRLNQIHNIFQERNQLENDEYKYQIRSLLTQDESKRFKKNKGIYLDWFMDQVTDKVCELFSNEVKED